MFANKAMKNSIAAISTANGTGGVAIIRISGEDSLAIAEKMFSSFPPEIEPNHMYAGKISGEGFTDYGFAVYFGAPKSFTGEDIVEFHCHGGVQISRGILKKALSLGARAAEKGEFTKRAYLNGKLTLSSAEGMIDMINAESLALVRAGSMMYTEKLSAEVFALQDKLKDALARIAVEIDYPEEDAAGDDLKMINAQLKDVYSGVKTLLNSYNSGKKIKHGVTVAICGLPNVGKSSLLNTLLGYDRAIVSPVAGTTRDSVEGSLEISGVLYNFIDTAGIRERAGEVEKIGIERAKKIIESADVVLSLSDGGGWAEIPDASGELIKVFNKSDVKTPSGGYDIAISVKTGRGIEELKTLISMKGVGELTSDKAYIVEERHMQSLEEAANSLNNAISAFDELSLDILSVDLRDAWESLGEITGETASEEIVNRVFEKFCVGK